MADLRRRFAGLDEIPMPDLWSDVQRRAADAPVGQAVVPVRGATVGFGSTRLGLLRLPTWAALLLAAAVIASLLTAGWLASQRPAPSTQPTLPGIGPAPTSSTTVTRPAPSDATSPTGCRPPADTLHLDLEPPIAALRVADCSIWVIRWSDGALLRIDPSTGATVATIHLDDRASSVTTAGNDLWVAGRVTESGQPVARGFIARIDPGTNAVVATLTAPVDGDPTFGTQKTTVGVYVDVIGQTAFVHAMESGDPPIAQTVVDLSTGEVRGMIADGDVVTIGSSTYVVEYVPGTGGIRVARLDLSTLKESLVRYDKNLGSWSLGRDSLVVSTWGNEVFSMSPKTGAETPLSLGFRPTEFVQTAAAGPTTVFLRSVLTQPAGQVKPGPETRELVFLDNVAGSVLDRIDVAHQSPAGVWAGDGRAWILATDGTLTSYPLPGG